MACEEAAAGPQQAHGDDTPATPHVPVDVLMAHMVAAPGLTLTDVYRICTMDRAALGAARRALGWPRGSSAPGRGQDVLEHALRTELPRLCEHLDSRPGDVVRTLVSGGADLNLAGFVLLARRLRAVHTHARADPGAEAGRALLECDVLPPTLLRRPAPSPAALAATLQLLLALHWYVEEAGPAHGCRSAAAHLPVRCAPCLLCLEYALYCLVRLRPDGASRACCMRDSLRSTAVEKAREVMTELDTSRACLNDYPHVRRLRCVCAEIMDLA